MDYDFCGYATKNDLVCADGRVIRHNAFKDNDGQRVPLVWQHVHDDPKNVLGHALLENRDDGVYAYATFNDTDEGKHARKMVQHGDVVSMSIYANHLKQNGHDVIHGVIREVSLVLAGANPGALIDNISFAHADGSYTDVDDEAIIYSGDENILFMSHADEETDEKEDSMPDEKKAKPADDKTVEDVFNELTEEQKKVVYFLIGKAIEENDSDTDEDEEEDEPEDVRHADDDMTVQEVFDSLTKDQKDVVYFLIGKAVEQATGADDDDNEADDDVEHGDFYGGYDMKHNVFDGNEYEADDVLTHDEFSAIMEDAKNSSSLKDVFLSHGVTHLDVLFPEAKMVRPTPDMMTRQMGWVDKLWNSVHRSPFARVKSVAANLTLDAARAKGYVKGNQKVDEQFELLSREVLPQTIYKKQTLDRDDVVDITDLDVIAWLKQEMRLMLNEELCRAILIGDGRGSTSPEKIKEANIIPIAKDAATYTIHYTVTHGEDATVDEKSSDLVDAAVRARKDYQGTGNPVMFATNDIITNMLLAKDKLGRRLYKDMTELAAALRVSEVIEVPVMEGATRTVTVDSTTTTYNIEAIIVNPADYTIGADKGGAVSLFDDFDINYNQMKYLIETRCSGALTRPHSAISIETVAE